MVGKQFGLLNISMPRKRISHTQVMVTNHLSPDVWKTESGPYMYRTHSAGAGSHGRSKPRVGSSCSYSQLQWAVVVNRTTSLAIGALILAWMVELVMQQRFFRGSLSQG